MSLKDISEKQQKSIQKLPRVSRFYPKGIHGDIGVYVNRSSIHPSTTEWSGTVRRTDFSQQSSFLSDGKEAAQKAQMIILPPLCLKDLDIDACCVLRPDIFMCVSSFKANTFKYLLIIKRKRMIQLLFCVLYNSSRYRCILLISKIFSEKIHPSDASLYYWAFDISLTFKLLPYPSNCYWKAFLSLPFQLSSFTVMQGFWHWAVYLKIAVKMSFQVFPG